MRRPRLRAFIAPGARVVAALLLIASLFSVWRLPVIENGGYFLIFDLSAGFDPGSFFDLGFTDADFEDGWERWRLLDIAFIALALGLIATTFVRRRALAALVALGAIAAGICVALSGFNSISPGPYLAVVALTLAILALAPLLRRPRLRRPRARRRAPTL